MSTFTQPPINRQQLQQIIDNNPGMTCRELITRMQIPGRNPLNRIKYVLDIMLDDERVFMQKDGRDIRCFKYQYAIDNNIQEVAPLDQSGMSGMAKAESKALSGQKLFNSLWTTPSRVSAT